jgi:hypothetical protein
MGLVTFASFMIAADLLFIPDEDYQRWGRYLTRLHIQFMRWKAQRVRRLQTTEQQE